MHGTKCQIELNERTNESGHSSICSYRICKYGKRLQIVIPGMECPECFWFHMRMMMGEHNKMKWQKCFLICILKLQECGKKSQPQIQHSIDKGNAKPILHLLGKILTLQSYDLWLSRYFRVVSAVTFIKYSKHFNICFIKHERYCNSMMFVWYFLMNPSIFQQSII